MFPHPETVFVVRDMERRLQLDRLAQERALLAEAAEPASPSERRDARRVPPLPRIAPRWLGWLPLARPVDSLGVWRP